MVRTSISLGQKSLVSVPLILIARIISHETINNSNKLEIHTDLNEKLFNTSLVVRQPFTIEFQLNSICDIVLPLKIKFERSDVFVFSGLKEVLNRYNNNNNNKWFIKHKIYYLVFITTYAW